ncbi:MAG: Tail Collar domain protein [Anaerolineales bacterium]|nr:Tail Collar domain protein [Anaerolineales bacterium]
MALTVTVQRGYTPQAGVPMTLADWLALALPTVTVTGASGPNDLAAGAYHKVLAPAAYFYATGVLAAGIYTITFAEQLPASWAEGMSFWFKPDVDNTGATDITIALLTGTKNLFRLDGSELSAGDLRAGKPALVHYNGTDAYLVGRAQAWPDRYAVTSGTATAYTLATVPTLKALAAGARVLAKVHASNTAAATLAVDGLTAKPIRKHGNVPLDAGDLQLNAVAEFVYDATLDVWLLASAVAPVLDVYAGTVAGAGSPTVYTLTAVTGLTPPSYLTGMRIRFVADVANTGAAQINLNTLGALTIKKANGASLATGDIKLGQAVALIYDGTNVQLVSPTASAEGSFSSTPQALPAASSAITPIAHELGATPKFVRWVALCVTPEHGYVANDEVDLQHLQRDDGEQVFFGVSDGTTCGLVRGTGVISILHKTTGAELGVTAGSWNLKVYARL